MEILKRHYIKKYKKLDNKGRTKLHIRKSDLIFPNIYSDYNHKTALNLKELKDIQYNKVREEFYELMAEGINSKEFSEELLDLITACISLYHLLNGNDKTIYNNVINKFNKRVQDKNYKWTTQKKEVDFL